MHNLKADEIRLIKKYNHDLDNLIDVVKVLCHDAYNKGLEDGYDQGFNVGYNVGEGGGWCDCMDHYDI